MSWSETLDALIVSRIDEKTFDWIFQPLKKPSVTIKRRRG
jgi:hypothetical protein